MRRQLVWVLKICQRVKHKIPFSVTFFVDRIRTSGLGIMNDIGCELDYILGLPRYYHTLPRKYSIVRAKPSFKGTFGSQCNLVFARVMSGFRCFGSSCGSGISACCATRWPQ